MIRRIGIVATVIVLLVGVIALSQYRPMPDRVSGFIESDEIRLGSRLGGRVHKVHVEEGQAVTEGQVLVELEPYDLLQREQEAMKTLASLEAEYKRLAAGFRSEEIAQAESRYEQFKARYEMILAGPRQQEIDAAKGLLEVAQTERVLAQQNYDRSKKLVDENAISQAEFDTAMEKLDASRSLVSVRTEELALLTAGSREEEKRESKARMDEAEQAWLLVKNGYRREEIEKAKAARDAARSALDVIGEQKKELIIKSPVDGVIEALDLHKGDLVPTGAPVLSVMDMRNLWVRAYVPQNRIGLQVGQQLRVTVDSVPGESLLGEITFISRQAEFTPNNVQTPEERSKQVFRIKVALGEGIGKLRPGMTADVWIASSDASP
jgi:HlyD family secretion protein